MSKRKNPGFSKRMERFLDKTWARMRRDEVHAARHAHKRNWYQHELELISF